MYSALKKPWYGFKLSRMSRLPRRWLALLFDENKHFRELTDDCVLALTHLRSSVDVNLLLHRPTDVVCCLFNNENVQYLVLFKR